MALAYFITFSTYGTWLHGTDKGLGSVDREHNQHGTPFVEPDAERIEDERKAMTQPAWVMDAPRRKVSRDAIVEMCREKGWDLLALHVRSNHVHVVVSADREPGRLMSDLKARASRELNRVEEPLTSCSSQAVDKTREHASPVHGREGAGEDPVHDR